MGDIQRCYISIRLVKQVWQTCIHNVASAGRTPALQGAGRGRQVWESHSQVSWPVPGGPLRHRKLGGETGVVVTFTGLVAGAGRPPASQEAGEHRKPLAMNIHRE